jgi:hypothetical protein
LQLYAAHILVVVVRIAVIAGVAQGTHDANDLNASNVAAFITKAALGIRSDAGPCDTGPSIRTCFPLYILLLGTFAPALWLMIRKPILILGCSIAVYLAGRHFGRNLSSSRSAVWYFNPFAWQLLFFLGAWVALGGAAAVQSIVRTRTVFWLAIAYLVFALVVTMSINSFCAHAAIEASLNSLWVQIFVGTLGVLLMTAVAYYGTWPKRRYPILPSPGSNWQNAVPSKSV